MNIDPVKRPTPITLKGVTRRATTSNPGAEGAGEAVIDHIKRKDLVNQLMKMDETRPDVVELGRQLAKDPSYPPAFVIKRLAEVLAELPDTWLDEEIEEHEISPERE